MKIQSISYAKRKLKLLSVGEVKDGIKKYCQHHSYYNLPKTCDIGRIIAEMPDALGSAADLVHRVQHR